jgi:hypothetical protein
MFHFDPQDPAEDALQPTEVRFIEARVEPWPDGRRVRVHLLITPFTQRPNLRAIIKNLLGEEICSAHIIETIDNRIVFTLHLRGEITERNYLLDISLYYEDIGEVDSRHVEFEIQPGE